MWVPQASSSCGTLGFAAAGFLAALGAAGFFALTGLSAFGFAAACLGNSRFAFSSQID